MKYLLYKSETKIAMLLDSIPREYKVKLSSKWKINTGIFSGELNVEEIPDDSKNKRLELVENYIIENEKIGPCYKPERWIQENKLGLKIIRPFGVMNQNSTLFVKRLNEHTLFVLGGSTNNLIGNSRPETVHSSYSYTDRVLDSLECLIRNNTAIKRTEKDDNWTEVELNGATESRWKLQPLFNIVESLESNSNFPEQKVSFLAKRLVVSKNENKTIIIGSPLYVSLDD